MISAQWSADKPLDGGLRTPKTTPPLSWAALSRMRRLQRPNDPRQRSDVFKGEGVKSLGPPWTELQWATLRNVIELAEDS